MLALWLEFRTLSLKVLGPNLSWVAKMWAHKPKSVGVRESLHPAGRPAGEIAAGQCKKTSPMQPLDGRKGQKDFAIAEQSLMRGPLPSAAKSAGTRDRCPLGKPNGAWRQGLGRETHNRHHSGKKSSDAASGVGGCSRGCWPNSGATTPPAGGSLPRCGATGNGGLGDRPIQRALMCRICMERAHERGQLLRMFISRCFRALRFVALGKESAALSFR